MHARVLAMRGALYICMLSPDSQQGDPQVLAQPRHLLLLKARDLHGSKQECRRTLERRQVPPFLAGEAEKGDTRSACQTGQGLTRRWCRRCT